MISRIRTGASTAIADRIRDGVSKAVLSTGANYKLGTATTGGEPIISDTPTAEPKKFPWWTFPVATVATILTFLGIRKLIKKSRRKRRK